MLETFQDQQSCNPTNQIQQTLTAKHLRRNFEHTYKPVSALCEQKLTLTQESRHRDTITITAVVNVRLQTKHEMNAIPRPTPAYCNQRSKCKQPPLRDLEQTFAAQRRIYLFSSAFNHKRSRLVNVATRILLPIDPLCTRQ